MMADAARRHQITATGGRVERQASGPLYNSMPLYGPAGLLDTYRKVHLSRVLGVTSESDVFAAGDRCVSVDLADSEDGSLRISNRPRPFFKLSVGLYTRLYFT